MESTVYVLSEVNLLALGYSAWQEADLQVTGTLPHLPLLMTLIYIFFLKFSNRNFSLNLKIVIIRKPLSVHNL